MLVAALAFAADAQPPVVVAIVAVALAAIAVIEQIQHPAKHLFEVE